MKIYRNKSNIAINLEKIFEFHLGKELHYFTIYGTHESNPISKIVIIETFDTKEESEKCFVKLIDYMCR